MLQAAFPGGDPDVDAAGRQVYTDYRSYSENLNKGECMPTIKVLARGQLTIPAALRKELHLEEETVLNVIKVGGRPDPDGQGFDRRQAGEEGREGDEESGPGPG